MSPVRLKIGTRGSPLALWQANHVKANLEALAPGADVGIVVIKTSGDRIQDRALIEVGGKGLFVKEIQVALLEGSVDLAIHSLKDYPVENPPELTLACVPRREDPRDALVLPPGVPGDALRADARVGTGSLRRHYQAALLHPGWRIEGLRGNVETRLRKVDEGELDGTILAAAGLRRLGMEGRITRLFTPDEMIPAVGQGALAVETRRDREDVGAVLAPFQDPEARLRVDAERRFLEGLGGSCTTPMGIHASLEGGRMVLRAFLASLDGSRHLKGREEGPASEAIAMADRLLARFWADGARDLLEEGAQ